MVASSRPSCSHVSTVTPGAAGVQLMAAIQSVHTRRALTGRTDRRAVADLYAGLARLTPTVGVLVAHAAAVLAADGPGPALGLLDALPPDRVAGYQPYWVVRARALAQDHPAAAAARRRALDLTTDPVVRSHLQRDEA